MPLLSLIKNANQKCRNSRIIVKHRILGIISGLAFYLAALNTRSYTNRSTWQEYSELHGAWKHMNAAIAANKGSPLDSRTYSMNEEKNEIISFATPSNEFSGCLILKDDNQVLPEWLAYHFTVLPLRHLIVAVDSLSLTSPEPIFDAFREVGINITLWTDKDLKRNAGSTRWLERPDNLNGRGTFNDHHQYLVWRQNIFYTQCLRELKLRGITTWTAIIDTDEYIGFNYYKSGEGEPWHCGQHKRINETARKLCNEEYIRLIQEGVHPRTALPQVGNVTVAQYIASVVGTDPMWEKPCIVLPRVTFGGQESTPEEIFAQIPTGFNPEAFNTLRFLKHGEKQSPYPGKSIADLSRYDNRSVVNPHRIFRQGCRNGPFVKFAESVLRIHHYTGSLESYLSRPGDVRRTKEGFEDRNKHVTGNLTDDTMRPWLKAFAEMVGKHRALELTEKLRDWALQDDERASKEIEVKGENYAYPFK